MAGVSDDFAARLEAYAAEHGKPLEDMRPGERDVAERSVRLVMDREVKEAERAAESAERSRELEASLGARWMLLSGMTTFARDQLDRDGIRAVNLHDQPCSLLVSGLPCNCGQPSQVRRDIAFKRKLLDELIPKIGEMADAIEYEGLNAEVVDAETLLRELCATWNDRPGYQHQWAPPS